MTIDVANTQMVGTNGQEISVFLPRQVMTPTEALVHAGWLVVLAETAGIGDDSVPTFDEVRQAIEAI